MKNTLRIITLMAVLQAGTVFAAGGGEGGGISLAGWIFIGFLAVIFAMQLIPSLFMFGSMMRAVFGKNQQDTAINNGKVNNP
ncbi:MAG: hypothetical protein DRH03_09965 [Deltaproteobacteria bacterium]|nr:MAG: hypothetical protein DRH03_09965 [Deltaproteobacteria bacterium]